MGSIVLTIMSIALRRAAERGHADHGWLDTCHTFSFADYHDPRFMGFRALRVINEDCVAPGRGFATHAHRDMEIITYVLEGALEHRDSLGTGSVIRPGEVQRMSAGTGVRHSEFNPSADEPVHLLQIWIVPAKAGIEPGYEQKTFADADKRGRLRLVASPDGARRLGDDPPGRARLRRRCSAAGQQVVHSLAPGRHAWVHVARGALTLNGQRLTAGDGAAVSNESVLTLVGEQDAEALLFDLP